MRIGNIWESGIDVTDWVCATEIEGMARREGLKEKALNPCPGFSWEKVNFLLSSWCSTVFCIWHENNVDNTLMVLVVAK